MDGLKKVFNIIIKWCYQNISCLCLIVLFIFMYMMIHVSDDFFLATTIPLYKAENIEFYRYFTGILSHANLLHLIANSIALLCISSILTPVVGRFKIIILFFLGIAAPLSEVLTNVQYNYNIVAPNTTYHGGSSWGIFTLYGSFLVVYPTYRKNFNFKWYRFDSLFSIFYFVLAGFNFVDLYGGLDSKLKYWFAANTHTMALATGVVVTFILVLIGFIKPKEDSNSFENSTSDEISENNNLG